MLEWDFDKGLEYADKMRPILGGLNNGEIWYTLVYLAHRLLLRWYDCDDIAQIVECEVSDAEFASFRDFAWEYGDDAAANLIREYWDAWRGSEQYADWLDQCSEEDGHDGE